MLIYDPQSGAWTQERIPGPFYQKFECACAHYGRIFAFLERRCCIRASPRRFVVRLHVRTMHMRGMHPIPRGL